MKRLLVMITLIALLLSGCALNSLRDGWWPYVGASEQELYDNWGESWDCSRHRSAYGGSKSCWYSVDPFIGVTRSYCKERLATNVLVTIQDGEVVSVYWPS